MLKSLRFFFYAMMTASLVLTACSGDDGDPGPKGDTGAEGEKGDKGDKGDTGAEGEDGTDGIDAAAKAGYFQGTIKGNRRDGTAFEEAFKYEYVFGDEVFPTDEILKHIRT